MLDHSATTPAEMASMAESFALSPPSNWMGSRVMVYVGRSGNWAGSNRLQAIFEDRRQYMQRVEYAGYDGRTGQFEWLEGGLHIGSFSLK
jgi:hypothetical protein